MKVKNLFISLILLGALVVPLRAESPLSLFFFNKKAKVINELAKTTKLVEAENYLDAIFVLNKVMLQLKELQKKQLVVFFPQDFSGFKFEDVSLQNEIANGSFVLFAREYKNDKDGAIDLNLVELDPKEGNYIEMMNSFKESDDSENIKVIKIKDKYQTLEKISNKNYVELNIILNKKILLNIIVNADDAKKISEEIINKIDFEKLDDFLKKKKDKK
ncbi:MAG: hypothetical protein WC860_09705 [Candidatus Margulisiibacteriota bacterium]|jgi:hypothetical protein